MSLFILGIDPGKTTGVCLYDAKRRSALTFEFFPYSHPTMCRKITRSVREYIDTGDEDVDQVVIAIEGMESRFNASSPVNNQLFLDNAWLAGSLAVDLLHLLDDAVTDFELDWDVPCVLMIKPRHVKIAVGGSTNVRNITPYVVNHFDPRGDFGSYGKGTKDNPGPLYGISGKHMWDAASVCIAALYIIKGEYRIDVEDITPPLFDSASNAKFISEWGNK